MLIVYDVVGRWDTLFRPEIMKKQHKKEEKIIRRYFAKVSIHLVAVTKSFASVQFIGGGHQAICIGAINLVAICIVILAGIIFIFLFLKAFRIALYATYSISRRINCLRLTKKQMMMRPVRTEQSSRKLPLSNISFCGS